MNNTTALLTKTITLLMFASTFILTGLSHAETTTPAVIPDEEQPVHITADSLESQEQQGISIYKGNVLITQGSLQLNGDIITVNHPNSLVTKVTATGKPANFRRYSQVDQAWLTGNATQIEYNAKEKTILLTGEAQVSQPGKHLIKGPKLFYDIGKQTLLAKGTKEDKGRVSVTFTPAPAEKKEP